MSKWPKHIEECISVSLEYGSNMRFRTNNEQDTHSIAAVLDNPSFIWVPAPQDIEQYGNDYDASHTYWFDTHDLANLFASDTRIALHHRRVSGVTGKTVFFETLEVFGK